MSGLAGSITTRPMRPVFSRPIRVHVLPASVDLKMPSPTEIWLRIHASPVPAHTVFGSDGATASDPIDCTDLRVEEILLPVRAAVGGLGDAAGCAAGVIDERIAGNAGDR